jgi:hypothetical protein
MQTLTLFIVLVLAIFAIAKPLSHSHHRNHMRSGNSPEQTAAHQRRGIAFTDSTFLPYFEKGDNVHITWKYNWDSKADESSAWFRFVPMLHSRRPEHTGP